MTSSYPSLDRSDLRAALEAGPFSRRDEGYGLAGELLVVRERDGLVERAWGADAEQLEQVRSTFCDLEQVSVLEHGRVRLDSGAHTTAVAAGEAFHSGGVELAQRLTAWDLALVSCGADPWSDDPTPLEWCVRVPFGSPATASLRWRAAANLCVVSEALFAFSPLRALASCGVRSRGAEQRQQRRTHPELVLGGRTPLEGFLDWALETPAGAAPRAIAFGIWARHGVRGVFPDASDFERHVAALSAGVLPSRGLALRCFDGPPGAFQRVPLIVFATLLDDPGCVQELSTWDAAPRALWQAAAQGGLSDPLLASRARRVFALVADRLLARPGVYASPAMLAEFIAFGQRYTLSARTPADEWLSHHARRGALTLADIGALEQRWSVLTGRRAA